MSARLRELARETERIVASGGYPARGGHTVRPSRRRSRRRDRPAGARPGKRHRARAGSARARLTAARYLTTAAAAASLAAFASFAAVPAFAGTGVACGAQVTSVASTVPSSR